MLPQARPDAVKGDSHGTDEQVLPALRDVVDRGLVSPDTIFVPHAATAYVQAVAAPALAHHRWPPRDLRPERGGGAIDYSVVEADAAAICQHRCAS